MKALAILVHSKAGIISVPRIETLAHIREPHAALSARGSLRVKTVLNFDADIRVVSVVNGANAKLDPSSLGKVGDAVHDRVLHQWLKNQWRHHATEMPALDLLLDL